MFVVACVGLMLQGSVPEPSRAARVFEFVERASTQSNSHLLYEIADFVLVSSAVSDAVYPVPQFHAMCEDWFGGTMDVARARNLAAALCGVFGLRVRPVSLRGHDLSVDLDLADESTKIAIEIRGSASGEPFAEVANEDEAGGLGRAEWQLLSSDGWSIHTVELAQFPRMDEGDFTSTLTFLVGVVEFLNGVTAGEDVDLSGLLFAHEMRAPPLGDERAVDGVRETVRYPCPQWLFQSDGTPRRVVFTPAVFRTTEELPSQHVEGAFGRRPEPKFTSRPATTRGAPSVMLWSCFRSHETCGLDWYTVRVTLRQTIDGLEHTHTSTSNVLFVPPEFDLMQPFVVDITLSPATYDLPRPLRIGVCAARR